MSHLDLDIKSYTTVTKSSILPKFNISQTNFKVKKSNISKLDEKIIIRHTKRNSEKFFTVFQYFSGIEKSFTWENIHAYVPCMIRSKKQNQKLDSKLFKFCSKLMKKQHTQNKRRKISLTCLRTHRRSHTDKAHEGHT